jgi:hypothetical protein
MHSKCLVFFSFEFWVGCSQHVPFKVLMCSHEVLNMFPRFPMCSPRVFSIAPRFNPICFAQSPPLLTYIGGPKGEALRLYIESSILGSLHSFNLLLQWANQIGSLQKNKVGLVRHLQLICMKHNKYPKFIYMMNMYKALILDITIKLSGGKG